MLSKAARTQILETLLRCIHHISDKEYQLRVWLQGKGPEVDDYTETCCLFLEEIDDILEKYKSFGITEIQLSALKKLRDEFYLFNKNQGSLVPFSLITDDWNIVCELAKEVLKTFDYKSSH